VPLLAATDVYAGYGETEILHGVSLRVEPGEFVAIIGPNGAGKSTLVKAIIGLVPASKGRIVFEGRDIANSRPEDLVPAGLAYIPQTSNPFSSMTVRENLEMGGAILRPPLGPGELLSLGTALLSASPRIRRLLGDSADAARTRRADRSRLEQRIETVLDLFPDLRERAGHRVRDLSGGQQQMVALARALVLEPKLLLVDEPSAGLAPKLVAMVFEKISQINDQGVGIVLVEQNARKALALADRGYVLELGRNRFEGSGQGLLKDPEVKRLYLGG